MTITLSVHRAAAAPRELVVRVGQRLLVRVAAPLGKPGSGSQVDRNAAVVDGGWGPPSCSPGYRCYAFKAARPGVGQVAAMTPSGCLKGHGCILGLTAYRGIYVVPRSCPDLPVTLLARVRRRHGSLAVMPRSAAGRTNRLVDYALGLFTDSDPEPHAIPGGYAARVNWGDGMTNDAGIARAPGARGFKVDGTHFYCRGGARTVALTLSKSPASLFHVGESVTLTYRVRFG